MQTLKINLTQLNSTINVYNNAITDFENAFKELEDAMNILQNSGWKSNASTQYFSLYNSSWKDNMKRHMEIIEHLRSCLNEAETEYTTLYNKVHTLGQNL